MPHDTGKLVTVEFTISFIVTEGEIKEATNHHLAACAPHDKKFRKKIRDQRATSIAYGFGVFLFCLPALFALFGLDPPSAAKGIEHNLGAILIALAAIGIACGGVFLKKWAEWWTIRRLAATAPLETITITDKEIAFSSPTIVVTMTWGHFYFWHQTPNLYMLYTKEFVPRVIPKRSFSGLEERKVFEDLCGAGINKVPGAFPVSFDSKTTSTI